MENLELTNSQIEVFDDEERIEPKAIKSEPVPQEQRAEEINQQLIDLELKFSQFEDEIDDDDDDVVL